MYGSIVNNLKRVIFGISPIIILVLILSLIFKIDGSTIIRFLSSSILVIIGSTLFTTGAEISLNVIGERMSRILIKKKNCEDFKRKKINFKYILISGYLLIFLILMLSEFEIIPFAFDMASVTTGAISAPFILALGVGFASKSRSKDAKNSEFGILSICSLIKAISKSSALNISLNSLTFFKNCGI